MAARQTKQALEVKRKNAAKLRMRDIWTQRMSVQYTEARKVTAAQVEQELEVTEWEEEFTVPGRNTHVIYTSFIFLI